MSKIDILLPTYNGAIYLSEQIDSLIKQSYTDWRLLIRDDGSKDSTIDVVKSYTEKYPDKILLISDNCDNLGSTHSFACLMGQADAEYVMFCDQDDVWLPNKIERSISAMEQMEKEYGKNIPLMAFTDLSVVDSKLNLIHKSFVKSQKLYIDAIKTPYRALAHNVVAGCTVIINRLAIMCCLPIPKLGVVHDQWILVNVAYYGKVRFVDYQTILYRQHESNAVGAKNIGIRYMWSKLIDKKNILIYFDIIDNLNFQLSKKWYLCHKLYYSLRRLF